MQVRYFTVEDVNEWDSFVKNHPDATHCHLSGWKVAFEKTYGQKSFYLIAEEGNKIVGILPLFLIKSYFLGKSLVSMPYLSYGGILSESEDAAQLLFDKACDLFKELGVVSLELRHLNFNYSNLFTKLKFNEISEKVTLLRNLPVNSETLFNSFKSKLRSQIRRPIKEGMNFALGGKEYIDTFYKIFAVNMRDLGSPVHSKELFFQIFEHLKENARIGIVYYQTEPVAGGVIIQFNKSVEIPWASSLMEYKRMSPNMLLYWGLLDYACNEGYEIFDFGRSTPHEGTFRFKKQWGAQPYPLHWYILNDKIDNSKSISQSKPMELAAFFWKKLPIPIANFAGPMIRKTISL